MKLTLFPLSYSPVCTVIVYSARVYISVFHANNQRMKTEKSQCRSVSSDDGGWWEMSRIKRKMCLNLRPAQFSRPTEVVSVVSQGQLKFLSLLFHIVIIVANLTENIIHDDHCFG